MAVAVATPVSRRARSRFSSGTQASVPGSMPSASQYRRRAASGSAHTTEVVAISEKRTPSGSSRIDSGGCRCPIISRAGTPSGPENRHSSLSMSPNS